MYTVLYVHFISVKLGGGRAVNQRSNIRLMLPCLPTLKLLSSPVAFLYTNNENAEREIRESIPFTIAPRNIRYLGINLTKELKDVLKELQNTYERN